MARFTTYNALRKLITVPHTTIATTNGQETRHIFLKNDLDHTVDVPKGGKSVRLGTSNRQDIATGTKELIDIVTGNLVRKVTQSNGSQLLRVSGARNVKTIDTKPFWKKVAMALTKSTSEFYEFTRRNGVKQTLIAPYYLPSNGQAERFVQTLKQFFKVGEATQTKFRSIFVQL